MSEKDNPLDNLLDPELSPVQKAEIENGATPPETFDENAVPDDSPVPTIGDMPEDPSEDEVTIEKPSDVVKTTNEVSDEELMKAAMKDSLSAPVMTATEIEPEIDNHFPVIFALVNLPQAKFRRDIIADAEGNQRVQYTPTNERVMRKPANDVKISFIVKNALGQKEERTLTFNADGLYIAEDESAEVLGDIAMSQAKIKVPYGGGMKTISVMKKFTQKQFQEVHENKIQKDKESFIKSLTPEQIVAVLEAKEKGKI